MKAKFIFVLLISIVQLAFGQIERPAKWHYEASKTNVKLGETIEIVFTAELKEGWYMYSIGPFDTAPVTSFTFEKNGSFELVGEIKPIKSKHKVDQYIGEYDYFTEKAVFKQKIKILSKSVKIKGTYEYSTCSLQSGICLPPKDEEFELKAFTVTGELEQKQTSMKVEKTPVINQNEIKAEDLNEEVKSNDTLAQIAALDASLNKPQDPIIESAPKIESSSSTDLLGLFILAFLFGLTALITPCVFPMIPMTVTFFLNSGKSRLDGILKALFYGLSIIFIYTLIGTLVAKLAGAEAANFLSTHWVPNLFFFATFILFALSFLGLFDIVLPSGLVNASDRMADKGGLFGIFFMAFTLVLVSFSCTGPIVGTILVQSANGEFIRPLVGMFGFSLAFAIPFTLFAIFPSWLSNLPKSGGWLNTVKVVLGFVELALAFKFFSLADQAYHWNILDRDINIAIWIAISVTLALYLFGKITLPHDDKLEKVGVMRLIFGMTVLTFAIYLIPGMWGAPLKPLSGYLPPLTSQDFLLKNTESSNANYSKGNITKEPRFADILHFQHGLKGYFDYNEALAASKELKKPIFVDFTGHGCTNCRKMEENVWVDPLVLSRLQNDFVLLALYVDDKTELPESEWFTSTYDGKIKKSIGKQNADFQIARYNTNAQPYYLVLDSEGKTISGPKAYDLNISSFVNFLDKGKAAFGK